MEFNRKHLNSKIKFENKKKIKLLDFKYKYFKSHLANGIPVLVLFLTNMGSPKNLRC